ncbi:MAG: hypothetical protein LBI43_05240 [Streptococcaceae bacterium]|jgi:tetrahydromethanopterin S-methyltransferase subunit A|nr:hypothetical protein [Streptococcaceae bacterium]
MGQDFNERLKVMREKYLENFPQDEAEQQAQLEAFKKMTTAEKLERIQSSLDILVEKKSLFKEKYHALKAEGKLDEAEETMSHIQMIADKIMHLEEKMAWIRSGETDPAKKERLKRQLAALELKRCKAQLDKKHCGKIDEKIAAKKEAFIKAYTKNTA